MKLKKSLELVAMGMIITAWAGCAPAKKMHHHEALPQPSGYNAHFPDMDINGDDRVTWEEFKRYFPETDQKVYKALDLNKDQAVDLDEWHAFKKAHGLGHQ